MSGLAVTAAVAVFVVVAIRLAIRWVKNHPEYKARVQARDDSYLAEDSVLEDVPWIGTTGLAEDVERELPKYLRREFGELLLDEGSLKAHDLTYVGNFKEDGLTVHYWRVPRSDEQLTYAYVEIDQQDQTCTGWGNREPPTGSAAAL